MAASTAHVSSTLFVRNLPYSATTKDLEALFGEIGPLKQCFVVTDRGVKDKCRGFGYVTFALRDDAEKAFTISHSVEGRKLKVDYADRKQKKGTPKDKKAEMTLSAVKDEDESTPSTTKQVEAVSTTTAQHNLEGKKTKKKKKKKKVKGEGSESISEREKRKSRLIVRNLPFKCTEDKLRSVFEAFGTVTEISIPVKEKKSMGFGFVQFDHLNKAARALKQMNGKQIMNRPVAVDWTVPRTEYLQALQKTKDSTPKDDDDEVSDGEEEMEEEHDDKDMSLDEEQENRDEVSSQESEEKDDSDMENDDEEMDDEDDKVDSDDSDDEDDEEEDDDDNEEEEENPAKERVKGHPFKKPVEDVQEGKTLFIRNVPYDSTDDDVRELFTPFGEIEFARVVVDPMTEHSRGTAFVKFKTKEDAANCLHEGDAVRLNGRLLALSPAISRSEAIKLRTAEKDKAKEEQKDKRNLHLLREGLIRPGTKAAEGLSEQYMNKRLKVENVKKEKLKNLNIFVSPTRLAIHNLPKAVDDKKLREIARESAGDKKAKVIEARIMRDMNNPNAQGVSKSLGFGFVEFTQYEHALATLLHLNNNAQLFGQDKRPIVGFSLENRRALEIKQKRREKALMKRQAFSKKPEEEDEEEDMRKEETKARKPYSQQRLQAQQKTGGEPHLTANRNMVMPQDGKKKGLPRHFGAKNRWRDRGKVAEEKRQRRKEKRMVLQKQVWNSMKAPEPAGLKVDKKTLRKEKQKNQKKKQNRAVREEKQFNAMVSKYKQKITHGGDKKLKGSSKWFEA